MLRMALALVILVLAAPIAAGAGMAVGETGDKQATISSRTVAAGTQDVASSATVEKQSSDGSATNLVSIFWDNHEAWRTLTLIAVAVGGFYFAWVRARIADKHAGAAHRQAAAAYEQASIANKQADAAEKRHFAGRFATAAEALGSEHLAVRLSGIFALWRLSEESSGRDVVSVIDIFCSFVRNPTTANDMDEFKDKRIRPDVQEIMNLLGDTNAGYRRHLPAGYCLNFDRSFLVYAKLVGLKFLNATFVLTHLERANFENAILTNADFTNTLLINVDFTNADLAEANFKWSNVSVADFKDARNMAKNALAEAYSGIETGDPKIDEYRGPPTNLPAGVDLPPEAG